MPEPKKEQILFSSDLYWGMPLYIKTDPLQMEYSLIEIKLLPGVTDKKGNQIPAVKFRLSNQNENIWLYDFECSTELNTLKKLENPDGEDEDD